MADEPKEPNKHEKTSPEIDTQVPPDKTPSSKELKPGKPGR